MNRAGQLLGFTLIEMLVVMVLLGLLTSLALPAMQRWHDAVQLRAQAAVVLDSLRAAAFASGASRREIAMNEASFKIAGAAGPEADAGGRGVAGDSRSLGAQPSESAVVAASEAAPGAGGSAEASELAGSAPVMASAARPLAVALPRGWRVTRVVAAAFLPNGLCRPGLVALQTDRGEDLVIQVHGPVCSVELQPAVAPT